MWTIKYVLGIIICFIFVVSVKGKGKFTVILKRMTNSEATNWNNGCCDGALWCTNACDTYFKVCLTAFPSPTSISNCMSGVQTSRKLGGNTFSMNYKVERPFNIKTQDFGVFIEAWDDDGSNDDLIDKHSATITAIPTYNGTVITSNTIRLTGRRRTSKTTLEIQYELYCNRFYYGPTCGTYCKYSDYINGHYWCNDNGTRVCLENWYGNNCTDYCFPRDDELGHYYCNSNGTKLCYQNWYGNNCTLWCFPRNSSSDGHYYCLSNGSIKCDSGWYGKNCTTYCWPKNNQYSNYTCDNNGTKICAAFWYGTMCNVFCKPDGFGHYRCDNATGSKVCHKDWYGASCTSYCVPRNDSTGHYDCNSVNGTKVCHKDWYGATCTSYCVPTNASTGHYSCDSDNGTKVCHKDWYGATCTSYCVPRNDSTGHYDCNSVNGTKVCHKDWYGATCTSYCVPTNASTGHYSCDSDNGTKVCHKDWYGATCTSYCVPRNDSTGHYSCDSINGTKVCHKDWYGASCTSHCVPTNDSTGHYSCDHVNGTKVCHKEWYGANCHLSCSTNQSLHQISCNSTNTIKSCPNFAVMCGNSLVSTTPMPTSSNIPKTNFSVFTTDLINLSVLISTSTIVNTRPTISKVSSTLYVQPTMTALNESTDMNTTKSTGKQTRQSEAWKYVSVSLGIVAFLVITTVTLIKYMRARIRRRISMCDQDEKKEKPPHIEDRYAVPLIQVRGQRMSIQSKDGFTTPPETPECFQIKDPSTWLLPEDSSLNRGIN